MKTLYLPLLLLTTWCSPSTHPLAASIPVAEVAAGGPEAALARIAYDFTRPAASYAMPAGLAELSGIAVSGPNRITCVEDETGHLYHYNLTSRRVERVTEFASNGDYEDVARVGNDWFVMRSDGTLFRYSGAGTQQYRTGLTLDNDVEGLAYDAASKTLLVACKGAPGGALAATKRAIYRLHPETYKVETPAAYVLDVAAIRAAVPGLESAAPTGKKGKKERGFAPSAVAIHPRTHHVFVLSARQNGLVELDPAGRMVAAQALPTNLFPQPEGLAFTPNGDLYIATEAGKKSGTAMIHLFHPQQ